MKLMNNLDIIHYLLYADNQIIQDKDIYNL